MKRVGIVAVMLVLAGPVWAQAAYPKYGEPDKARSQADIAGEKEAEKAYRRSLSNIPEQKSSDPWGTVRSDSAGPKHTEKNTEKKTDKAAARAAPAKPKAARTEPKTEATAKQ